ncbi:DUF981 family protein [Chishuiella changwenlii]|uniref:DUF981 family protein n=1 Tax=Chishuiella changwenlii TaxID=1434701 RepID=UPI002FD9D632
MNHEKLIIDWTQTITYNTIMALLVGVSLISIANIGKNLLKKENINPTGWSLNLAVLGLILSVTGLHMTLTWPLAKYFPFDNIIFGEPTLAFGVLNLVLSFYIWKHRNEILKQENPLKYVTNHLKVFKILFYALGLMLTSIFFAGVDFQFFAAPKEEPISGSFADYPWLEAWGLSLVFLGVGIASVLTARFTERAAKETYKADLVDKLGYVALMITGWFFLLFGAFNYYTHIGLILNTMK